MVIILEYHTGIKDSLTVMVKSFLFIETPIFNIYFYFLTKFYKSLNILSNKVALFFLIEGKTCLYVSKVIFIEVCPSL